ncbi:MAG: hypothetical protein LIP08_14070 [Bacteroides sp.]|nr:hypothetical protein [Bacteroides sp.]
MKRQKIIIPMVPHPSVTTKGGITKGTSNSSARVRAVSYAILRYKDA